MANHRHRSRGVLISAYGVLCSMVLPGAGHMAVGADLRRRKVITVFVLGLLSSIAFVVLIAPVGTKAGKNPPTPGKRAPAKRTRPAEEASGEDA